MTRTVEKGSEDLAVGLIASRILAIFAVTPEVAAAEARGIVAVTEAKGGVPTADDGLLEELLGKRLPWRSEEKRLAAQDRKRKGVEGYNAFLNTRKGFLERKW